MDKQQRDKEALKLRESPRDELDDIERKLIEDHEMARGSIRAIDHRIDQIDRERVRLCDQRQYNVGVADYTIGLAVDHHKKRKAPTPVIELARRDDQQP